MTQAPARQLRGQRRPGRGARTRERILEAAIQVFARRGFHGARVADIAEEAGIAYGLVYHHFANKDDILAALFAERWGRHLTYLEEVARSPAPFEEKLSRLIHFWVEAFREEPHLMTVIINEISRSYEFIESHDVGTVLVAFDLIGSIVEQARAAGEVRADADPQLVAYAVLGAAEMILTGYVMGTLRREKREDFRRDEAQLVSLIYRGLSPV